MNVILKCRNITLLTKVFLVKAMVFPKVMCGCWVGPLRKLSTKELMLLDCGVREDSWESLGLQGGSTNPFWRKSVLNIHWKDWCQAETPILWPPDAKNWLIGKDPDAGKDWRQEEKGITEDEMVGWHHRLYGHKFEQAPGVGDVQGSLACCNLWGCKSQTQLSSCTDSLNECKNSELDQKTFQVYVEGMSYVINGLGTLPFTWKEVGLLLCTLHSKIFQPYWRFKHKTRIKHETVSSHPTLMLQ